jgi:hypothetical protein
LQGTIRNERTRTLVINITQLAGDEGTEEFHKPGVTEKLYHDFYGSCALSR